MSLEKTIAKIKALHALASNNNQIEEVKAATAMADALMQKYRISAAMLEASGEIKAEPFVRKCVHYGGKRISWIERIVGAVGSNYGCVFYFSSGTAGERFSNYIVVGRESDCEIVNYMVNYLVGEGKRLSRWNNQGFGVAWSKSYLEGFGIGVSEQFAALKENAHKEARAAVEAANALVVAVGGTPQSSTTSCALVLLDKRKVEAEAYMNQTGNFDTYKRGPNKGKPKLSYIEGARSSVEGMLEGREAGRNVSLNKGLGGGSKEPTPKLGS